MLYETGCYGRIVLAQLPGAAQERLSGLPGEWLEFDPASATIVVRHTQPSCSPCLPSITGELVRMLAEIPADVQPNIAGGELFVRTESKGQLVRLRVEPGSALHIAWARPDYSRAERRPWPGGREALVPPAVQRLNGSASFETPAPGSAASEIQQLADSFEGLYPEGELVVQAGGLDRLAAGEARGKVQMSLRDVNLDVNLLLLLLEKLATPGSLAGRIEVSSFAGLAPEQNARFLFEEGRIWIQRPILWPEPSPEKAEAAAR